VWRHVGAFGHIAEVTEIALLHNLVIIGFGDAVHLHGGGFVDQVEQGGEAVAETDAAAAAVADVIHPLQFCIQLVLVPEIFRAPLDRVSGGCFQASFSHGNVLIHSVR